MAQGKRLELLFQNVLIRLYAVSWISMHHWNLINDVCSALPFEVGSSFYPSFAFQAEETTECYEYCTIS